MPSLTSSSPIRGQQKTKQAALQGQQETEQVALQELQETQQTLFFERSSRYFWGQQQTVIAMLAIAAIIVVARG